MPDSPLPLPPPPEPGTPAVAPTQTTLFGLEPALIAGLINAVIALAVSFGLHLSVETAGAIQTLVSVVSAIVVRQKSLPTPRVDGLIKTAIAMPTDATVAEVKQAHADAVSASKGDGK